MVEKEGEWRGHEDTGSICKVLLTSHALWLPGYTVREEARVRLRALVK
jgi:hypothetical protein